MDSIKKAQSKKAVAIYGHTTCSGKTLTSFKTAQLISKLEEIHKVLFVVDRKDLDYQTMKEYDRFQKGAASGSKNTKELKNRLINASKEHKIIITTIQKLSRFITKANKDNEIFDNHIAMIFDECHRSQFGAMQKLIAKSFKKLYLFGFSGTPIYAENAQGFETTESVFGECLHCYTIVHAIRDNNVLPFRVSYHSTIKQKQDFDTSTDKKVNAINTDEALLSPQRIESITNYILKHFDSQTMCNAKSYTLNNKRLKGFNAIFATQSIPMAMQYYKEFQAKAKNGHYLQLCTK